MLRADHQGGTYTRDPNKTEKLTHGGQKAAGRYQEGNRKREYKCGLAFYVGKKL